MHPRAALVWKAKEVTKGVFGAVAKCVKNLEAANDPDLVSAVMAELKKVDGESDVTAIFVWSLNCRTFVIYICIYIYTFFAVRF